jgi:hypothetical protein
MITLASAQRDKTARAHRLAGDAVRALARLAFAALVVFHVWLLVLHLAQGRALEPGTAARWLLSAFVVLGFRALNRRGLSLFAGRRAVGLWLLVVLIHCGAASDGRAAVLESAIPETVTALAQLAAAVAVIGTVLAVALALAAGPRHRGRFAYPVPVLIAGLPATGGVFRFSPRPPPLA